MENKLIEGLYCKAGKVEWKRVSIGIDVEKFSKELIRLKPKITDRGFLNVDICESRDGTRLYAQINDYNPNAVKKQVQSKEHSPDREDLPF